MTAAIELYGVGKRYTRPKESAMLFRSLLPFLRGRTDIETWALRDIDLKIEQSETVGILGRNGAGKTTILRLLAGVSQPTEGRLRVVGRIAPLISVGVGFHPEMSGRENVYVNGMLLGLTNREVRDRFDTIVEFSGLPEFVDTPVKFYSSGMLMRLGMAVAVHVDPAVLLVDEVLAVGDLAFQTKCLDRMRAMQRQGTTIVIVSHSMHAIQSMCPRALVFSHGQKIYDGDSAGAIAKHYELMAGSTDGEDGHHLTILEREIVGPHGPVHHAERGQRLTCRVRVRFESDVDHPQLRFQVRTDDNTLVYGARTTNLETFRAGDERTIEFDFNAALGGGNYRVNLTLFASDGFTELYDEISGPVVYLAPMHGAFGVTDLGAEIRVDGTVRNDHADVMMHKPTPRP